VHHTASSRGFRHGGVVKVLSATFKRLFGLGEVEKLMVGRFGAIFQVRVNTLTEM